jgi:TPR repeat protein
LASCQLGYTYQNLDGFKDLQKAVNWYQKAADNNYYGAKDHVKELNEQGYYAKEKQKGINYCYSYNNNNH